MLCAASNHSLYSCAPRARHALPLRDDRFFAKIEFRRTCGTLIRLRAFLPWRQAARAARERPAPRRRRCGSDSVRDQAICPANRCPNVRARSGRDLAGVGL